MCVHISSASSEQLCRKVLLSSISCALSCRGDTVQKPSDSFAHQELSQAVQCTTLHAIHNVNVCKALPIIDLIILLIKYTSVDICQKLCAIFEFPVLELSYMKNLVQVLEHMSDNN